MASNSNFEPYDFLCDNGFFDSSFVATPNEVKNEVVLNSKKVPTNINSQKKFLLDTLIYKLWKASDTELGLKYIGFSTLFIPVTCVIPYLRGNYDLLAISITAHSITYAILLTLTFGEVIASNLYKLCKGIRKGQIYYTLDFCNKIIPIEIYDVGWNADGEIIFKCTSTSLGKYIWLKDSELFSTPEMAANVISELKCNRLNALQSLLEEKAEAFLNGEKFIRCAHRYYLEKNVTVDGCFNHNDHISIYDFLTTKDSFIKFCEFIKCEKSAKEAAEQRKNAQAEKERTIINDALRSP